MCSTGSGLAAACRVSHPEHHLFTPSVYVMTSWRAVLSIAAFVVAPSLCRAQEPLRVALMVGPFRVDRLAGTPHVPSLGLLKPVRERVVVGGRLSLIRDAGFYGLDALTLDLDVGVRTRAARLEGQLSVGPWGMLGGDGDGTPYARVGGQGTAGATWWVRRRFGVVALATTRVNLADSDERVTSSAALGVVVRRRAAAR